MTIKRKVWKTALTCGIALSLSTMGLSLDNFGDAEAYAQKDKGGNNAGNKGGNKAGGGQGANRGRDEGNRGGDQARQGGNKQGRNFQGNPGQGNTGQGRSRQGAASPNSVGKRVQSTPGGNSSRSGGRGSMHVPPVTAGPRQPANRTAQQPRVNRTPTFSQPNVRGNGPDATPGSVTFRRQTQGPNRSHFGSNDRNGGVAGTIRRGEQNSRGNVNVEVRPTMRGSDFNRSRITNRPFDGNTVNFNDRRFNVGHNSYQPSYYRHSGYHGYWNGNRGFGGDRGYSYRRGYGRGYGNDYNSGWGWGLGIGYGEHTAYGYRPFGWGLGGWGLGSIIYNSGYLGYSNPYYVSGGWSGYSYSQPVVVTYNTAAVVVDDDPNSADDVLNNAIAAFQQNDYDASLDIVNNGITQFPDDAVLHEFRALVLFAKQDYQQAATTIHSVLAVGPGWDWTTLSSMYASVAIYTDHLRALELFSRDNPQDAAAHFLLAYHYMSCGHAEPAARQLRQVVELMPNDRVAADLLKMVEPPEPGPSGETAPQVPPRPAQELTRPAVKLVDPASLVGTWTAARDDGSTFGLTLTNDAKFRWSFAQKDQPAQEFEGIFSVEEDVLALERADGGSLIAEVTPRGDSAFNFKLIGAPEDDPGLNFSK